MHWCLDAVSNIQSNESQASSSSTTTTTSAPVTGVTPKAAQTPNKYAYYMTQYYQPTASTAYPSSSSSSSSSTTSAAAAISNIPQVSQTQSNPYSVNQSNPYSVNQSNPYSVNQSNPYSVNQSNTYQNLQQQQPPPPPIPPTNWQTQVAVTTQSISQQPSLSYSSYPQYGNSYQYQQYQQYHQQQQQQQQQLQSYHQIYNQQNSQIQSNVNSSVPTSTLYPSSIQQMNMNKPNPLRFAPPPPPPPPSENKTSQSKPGEYPPKLKKFVEDSFAKCENEDDRKYISDILRNIIQKVQADDRLHVHRWDLEPVPQLPRKIAANSSLKISINTAHNSTNNTYESSSNNSSPRGKESRKRKNRINLDDDDNDDKKYNTGFDKSEAKLSLRGNRFKQQNQDDYKDSNQNINKKKGKGKKIKDDYDHGQGILIMGDDEDEGGGMIVGLCEEMCPQEEKDSRDPGVCEDPNNKEFWIKTFVRSSAGAKLAIPNLVRTPAALLKTCKFIEEFLVPIFENYLDPQVQKRFRVQLDESGQIEEDYAVRLYQYLWYRFKMIANDLEMQSLALSKDLTWVSIHESMCRCLIIMDHHMQKYETFHHHLEQNRQQFNKSLKTLISMYRSDSWGFPNAPNRTEFTCYFILSQLGTPTECNRILRRQPPNILASPQLAFCLKVIEAYVTENYMMFFKLFKAADIYQACLLHPHIRAMRYTAIEQLIFRNKRPNDTNDVYQVDDFMRTLVFDNFQVAVNFLTYYGIEVNDDGNAIFNDIVQRREKMRGLINVVVDDDDDDRGNVDNGPPQTEYMLNNIEAKRSGLTFTDLCRGEGIKVQPVKK